ncbi:hypothetical protein [Shewanella sp. GXUN23E]|uniref:hypothetical protein n=1 Tax=Shewanella sp. GXUN23E TaxID=3422498 RepID=UPI003D7D879A
MKCAKDFAQWLYDRVGHFTDGVYLTRQDILELTDRQRFSSSFVNDIHYEVSRFKMGFVTDADKAQFYFFRLPDTHWKRVGDRYGVSTKPRADVHHINIKQGKS